MRRGVLILAAVPVLVLAGAMLFSEAARGDELKLKDGSKIVGAIVGFEDNSFKVRTSYGYALVQRDQVVSISISDTGIKADTEKKAEPAAEKPSVPARPAKTETAAATSAVPATAASSGAPVSRAAAPAAAEPRSNVATPLASPKAATESASVSAPTRAVAPASKPAPAAATATSPSAPPAA